MNSVVTENIEKLHNIFDRTDLDAEWTKIKHKLQETHYNPGDIRPLDDCIC